MLAMNRSSVFRKLARTIGIALYCEENKISTRKGLDQVADIEYCISRRKFIENTSKIALAVSFGSAIGSINRALAAPAPRSSLSIGIVGAGLAGLACGYELQKKGIDATLYEATNRVGGRCVSVGGFFPGQVAEAGGEFIDNLHKTLLGYVHEFKLQIEDVEKAPGEVFYYFKGNHIPESVVVDEFRDLIPAMHDDLRTLNQPTADHHTNADAKLDFTDLQKYLETRGAGEIITAAIKEAYIAEYGLEINKQSCLNFLFFIHADRRSKFRPFGIFSDERYHVLGGNQQITDELGHRLREQNQFGMRLIKAKKTTSGQIELTFKKGEAKYICNTCHGTPGGMGGEPGNSSLELSVVHDAIVFTIPFSVLRDVDIVGLELPTYKLKAINELVYGTNAKMMVGFNSRPWIALGSNGTSYSDLQNHQTTWETNPANATDEHAILTDYSGGTRGANLNPFQVQRETALFLKDLNLVYPGTLNAATRNGNERFHVHLAHWPSNPLTKGAYTCPHPGYFTTIAGNEQKPVGNVHFAGEHTDSFYEWQGFMEGAALSGVRAANEILNDIKKGIL
jgi:monoamine oxidase